jgi:hypothetical protein
MYRLAPDLSHASPSDTEDGCPMLLAFRHSRIIAATIELNSPNIREATK